MTLPVEDRLALHELLARYTHYLDYGRIDHMNEVWTDNCHFSADNPPVDIRGLDNLQAFFRSTVTTLPHVRHVISNLWIEPGTDGDSSGDRSGKNTSDDSAILHAYLQIVDFQSHALIAAGRYRDQVVRTPGGWRIQRREFTAG
ncbi:MAG TPA: nuclear transport factor 2 family protein [Spongiibacteraceae bacterium]|jgi:hypothetical protein|nr:nuclear transport factor 2 family protein [Spongiibacteraceae bacterium]HUH37615.1 nuclear transport factor 2 family protein [Spongiibacteraceae bacterium]